MAFTKSTVATNNISNLPNKPLITATALKQKFDDYGAADKTYVNGLIDELEATTGTSGAENIGSKTVSGLAGNTIWAQISALWTAVQNIVIGTLPDNSVTNDKIATASKIGLLADLTTSVKTSIVAAINSISLVLGDGTVTWPKLAPDMQNRELTQDKAITELLMLADIDSKVFSPNLGKFYTNFSTVMDYSLGAIDATKQTYTGTLSAGATNVVLSSATGFSAGQEISIQDATHYEDVIVQSVVSTTVSFKTPLVNSYTNPIVYRSNNNSAAFGGVGSALPTNSVLLCHMENNATDSATSKTPTVNGVTFSSSVKKFQSYSAQFNGSSNISFPSSSDFEFGSGDATIECWFYPTSLTGDVMLVRRENQNGDLTFLLAINDNIPYFGYAYGSGTYYIAQGSSVTINTWNHVAGVIQNNTVKFYVNGVLTNSTPSPNPVISSNSVLSIGSFQTNTGTKGKYFNGYIDEVLICKGYAKYTSNFTPASVPYGTGTYLTKNVIRMNITPYEDVKYISAWLTKTDLTGFTADGKLSIVDASADENYVDLTESITDMGATQEVMMIGNSATADSRVTLKLTLNRASTSDSVSFTKLIGGVSA